ncbi:MAG: hypothetical protein KF884_04995 [Fimbriimonadaceae bacterium]|nr:hypothetical protein [Fimbriimonadaceae bacterium]QYK59443.1 MAG: hypothetical protein KF884_04995 [Fimbriimonadaceae bacterium]
MLGLVGYSIGCLVIGALMTTIIHFFRPIKVNDDAKVWKPLIVSTLIAMAVPYIYGEVMTRMHGTGMSSGISEALDSAGVIGPLKYFRVMTASDSKATVIAVANDKNEWGMAENAVVEVDLVKDKGRWEATSYKIVNSFSRQRDETTMPPYW